MPILGEVNEAAHSQAAQAKKTELDGKAQQAASFHPSACSMHSPCTPTVWNHIDGGDSDKNRKMLSVRNGKCKILQTSLQF